MSPHQPTVSTPVRLHHYPFLAIAGLSHVRSPFSPQILNQCRKRIDLLAENKEELASQLRLLQELGECRIAANDRGRQLGLSHVFRKEIR